MGLNRRFGSKSRLPDLVYTPLRIELRVRFTMSWSSASAFAPLGLILRESGSSVVSPLKNADVVLLNDWLMTMMRNGLLQSGFASTR